MNNIFDIKKDYKKSLIYICLRSTTNIKLLEKFYKNEDFWLRAQIAKNTNTPIQILEYLWEDEYRGITAIVSKNPNWIKYMNEKI